MYLHILAFAEGDGPAGGIYDSDPLKRNMLYIVKENGLAGPVVKAVGTFGKLLFRKRDTAGRNLGLICAEEGPAVQIDDAFPVNTDILAPPGIRSEPAIPQAHCDNNPAPDNPSDRGRL